MLLGDQVEKQLNLDSEQQLPLPPQIDFKEFIPLNDVVLEDSLVSYLELLSKPVFSDILHESTFSNTILRPPIV